MRRPTADQIADAVAERLAKQLAGRLLDRVVDRLVERAGDRLAELVAEGRPAPAEPTGGLIDADEVAQRLGVKRTAVYAMVERGRLDAVRLGRGERPRLRFDPGTVDALLIRREREEAP